MLMTRERRPATRTLSGWAIDVLQEVGAIHECEGHGWAKDRVAPHAREHALDIARQEPPERLSPEQAVEELRDVLRSIGDTCPECSPSPDYSAALSHGVRGGYGRVQAKPARAAASAAARGHRLGWPLRPHGSWDRSRYFACGTS